RGRRRPARSVTVAAGDTARSGRRRRGRRRGQHPARLPGQPGPCVQRAAGLSQPGAGQAADGAGQASDVVVHLRDVRSGEMDIFSGTGMTRLRDPDLASRLAREATPMLPTEDLFVYVYVLIDDAIACGAIAIPPRPGPAPACSDAELLTIAQVRHLRARRSEAGFLAEVARDWAHLFPVLPHQSEASRRIRWLWGAFEQFRAHLAAGVPAGDCQQIDTSALPVRHTSRVRGPDGWTGPGGLHARFGRDAAHAGWFYGFRLAITPDLGGRTAGPGSIVPAAVNEREAGTDLLEGCPPTWLLAGKGFSGRAYAAEHAA